MRKITLFIAMSVDGYIADSKGDVAWLQGEKANENDMVSYEQFSKEIDTVLMGWNTYHQIKTQLSIDEWMYKDFKSYVFTHRNVVDEEGIYFVHEDIQSFIRKLKQQPGKGIWICGGAHIIQQFLEIDSIDCFHLSMIPTILGEGVPLFQSLPKECKLKLIRSETYNGIVDLVYERRFD